MDTLSEVKKLNLGCGPVQPENWTNVDGSNRAKLASKLPWLDSLLQKAGLIGETEFGPHIEVLDLSKKLPYESNSIDAIYAGELWEHFEYETAERLTRECARVLKPGGVLRVCVPDCEDIWKTYLDLVQQEKSKPADQRSDENIVKHVKMYFDDICTSRIWLGSMGHTHKWNYDEVQLVSLFQRCGLIDVERGKFHESRIDDVQTVERSDFLIVEGVAA